MTGELYGEQLREMVLRARQYLDGDGSFMDLYYAILASDQSVRRFGDNGHIRALCARWAEMAQRRRDEWGLSPDPLSDPEFRAWLRRQL